MLNNRIKARRRELGLSQQDMANKLGITRQGYGHYETGRNEPDLKTLQVITEELNCTIDFLTGKTDHPAPLLDKDSIKAYTAPLSVKDELDIAKRLEAIKSDIEHSEDLAFDGEPFSKEARESFLEAMEFIVRQSKIINKKYTPKKYRNNQD